MSRLYAAHATTEPQRSTGREIFRWYACWNREIYTLKFLCKLNGDKAIKCLWPQDMFRMQRLNIVDKVGYNTGLFTVFSMRWVLHVGIETAWLFLRDLPWSDCRVGSSQCLKWTFLARKRANFLQSCTVLSRRVCVRPEKFIAYV